MSETMNITVTINGEAITRDVPVQPEPCRFHPHRGRSDGQSCGLRAWRLRGLYHRGGRPGRARLPDACGAGGTGRTSPRSRVSAIGPRGCERRSRTATRCNADIARRGCWLVRWNTSNRAAPPTARRSASTFRAITAGAPAIRRSSKRSRTSSREAGHERAFRIRPAEFLYRQICAPSRLQAPSGRPGAVRRRSATAAHGSCRLHAVAFCTCRDQGLRPDRSEKGSGRRGDLYRPGFCRRGRALRRCPQPPCGPAQRAADASGRRARALAGRAPCDGRGAFPRRGGRRRGN